MRDALSPIEVLQRLNGAEPLAAKGGVPPLAKRAAMIDPTKLTPDKSKARRFRNVVELRKLARDFDAAHSDMQVLYYLLDDGSDDWIIEVVKVDGDYYGDTVGFVT